MQKARAYSAPLESIKRLSEPKRRVNGEGNIRKRKDGRWEGRYTVGHDPETGKAIIKNVLGKTQNEVKEKLKKAIEENVGIWQTCFVDYAEGERCPPRAARRTGKGRISDRKRTAPLGPQRHARNCP